MMESLIHMDGNFLLFIQENIRNPVLDPVMQVITSLGNAGIIWILLTILNGDHERLCAGLLPAGQ